MADCFFCFLFWLSFLLCVSMLCPLAGQSFFLWLSLLLCVSMLWPLVCLFVWRSLLLCGRCLIREAGGRVCLFSKCMLCCIRECFVVFVVT